MRAKALQAGLFTLSTGPGRPRNGGPRLTALFWKIFGKAELDS
jgi:hypothetical protein